MVKDQEYLNSIASQTIEYSKKLGATDVNVEVVHSISETVNLRNKQLDESNRSDSFAIGITTYINKKKSMSLFLLGNTFQFFLQQGGLLAFIRDLPLFSNIFKF